LAEPIPYLRVAVVNRCRSLHRRTVAAPQPENPTDVLMEVELIELRDALIALPIRQRSAIVLRYLCDLSEEEIAANLKCRRSTVRTLVRRGLAELREVIR
jgi:RNA polymerase sigma factor (sigma-70 family)